ncbi:hypothetical protein ACQPWR_24915 [Micromonospora vinacea]|uniref:hypothetical protein n=1 Tax=Micromonospora vinacea TaxID=709878 RepID=UPI003D8E3A59
MSKTEIFASVILGFLVNETCDLSPWLARRLVRWAARQWTEDETLVEVYAEDWSAIIDERPGKVFKLATALNFASGAASRATRIRFERLVSRDKTNASSTRRRRVRLRRSPLAAAFLMMIAASIVGLINGDWLSAIWSLTAAISIPAWILAVEAPTLCGVVNRRGQPCRNSTRGYIFGCGVANHTWVKAFAHVRMDRAVTASVHTWAYMPRPGRAQSGWVKGAQGAVRFAPQARVVVWVAAASLMITLAVAAADVLLIMI